MEWNLKHPLQWDWENLALFYEKEIEISRSIKQAEWTAEDGIISNESMYSSGSGTCSGSVVGNGSSNNSVTASVGSSSKAGNKVPESNIEITKGLPENQNSSYEIDRKKQRAFPATASCTGAGEPLIGLKLGKRTYFENFASTDIKTSAAVCLLPPASVKRPSICHQSIQHSYCQVEGCNVDLTTAKEYHRKHRVCESHSKSPKVIISGHERRFCQQCSRFHDLSEFDQKKRSCRRRLSEHNARRRKPQPDSHSFHPVKLTSTFYGERGQMDFFPNWTPFSNLRSSASCLRNDSHGFSLSLAKGSWSKPKVVADGQLLLPLDFSNVDTPSCNDLSKLMPLKCATAEVLNQGLEAPASASNLNRAPDLHRALSLLSSDVWIPPSTAQGETFQLGSSVSDVVSHPTVQVLNSAPACWQQDEHSLTFNNHSSGSQVQELNQLFSTSNGHFLEFRT